MVKSVDNIGLCIKSSVVKINKKKIVINLSSIANFYLHSTAPTHCKNNNSSSLLEQLFTIQLRGKLQQQF